MDITAGYDQQIILAHQQAEQYKAQANRYSLYRLGLFALFIAAVCVAVAVNNVYVIGISLLLLVVCFGWVIKRQNNAETLRNYFLNVKKVYENEVASINEYANMYNSGAVFNDDKHFYTADLDIFGAGSLFQFINRSATFPGLKKLAGWLKAPASKGVILQRQQAVEEIAGKTNWKIDFQANLLFSLNQQPKQIENLLNYLRLPVGLEDERVLRIYTVIAPWLLLILGVTGIFYSRVLYFIPAVLLLNNRLVSARSEAVDKTDLIAGRIGSTLAHFALAFKSIEIEGWDSVYLQNLAAKINVENGEAISDKIKQLSVLTNKLNYRLNLLVKFLLNCIFLWDIRQVIAIERWKKNNHQSFAAAFDVIAEYEAITGLASLRVNYPQWCVPVISESPAYTLKGSGIAHPLIDGRKRVKNDYELNDNFEIDIITGSNMAGKSTFLRTIGINTVLALCGAPVCAAGMEVSVITIFTYMRIKDSLNESTSTFKAELDRLQMLLAAVASDQKVFFLVDEMLRGTNSVDKYLGSKAVIEQLIRKKAVGMVATHDLQIADLEAAYPHYIRNYYFDIQVKDGEMLFDYKIKQGACKTFNASMLLKRIGIDIY